MLAWLAALAAVAVCFLAALRNARWRAAASLRHFTGAARLCYRAHAPAMPPFWLNKLESVLVTTDRHSATA